jgi:hypothetical protein
VSGVATESLLAAGYGLFLALAALGVDALARLSHRRSELYRTAGFTYHEHVDAWDCPEGERLQGWDRPGGSLGPLPGARPRLQRLPAKG